jgi:hypothetical protein
MTPESRNSLLLGNGSLNIFPRKRTRATTEEPVSKQQIGKNTTTGVLLETVFSVGGRPRGNIARISGSWETDWRESLEAAVEEDGEEKTWCGLWNVVTSCFKCAIHPVINPKPVYKSCTPQIRDNTVNIRRRGARIKIWMLHTPKSCPQLARNNSEHSETYGLKGNRFYAVTRQRNKLRCLRRCTLNIYYYIHAGNIDKQCMLAPVLKSRHHLPRASPPLGAISALWAIKPKLQCKIQ